ncbi:prostaglandin reductase [Holotrichia oblita]|uniref:Prostaglandin reductase n=1 Tax=Holotrichia oblita TaxID=644536 RepID=A0ACB9TKZ6_HOLOL|nr:prostaglandin reductase [Holotrichia oblita]
MVRAKKYIYVKEYEGMPTDENVKIVEEELPSLKNGVEAVYLSVDPYMRAYAPNYKIGDTLIGTQVAKIIESKSTKFPVGKHVVGAFGWRSHSIARDDVPRAEWNVPYLVNIDESLPLSLALEICKPQAGETVVVSGAAGAVGSIVGQIAKIKGCKVIGIAGSDEKGQWLKSLGFDHVINYKTQDIRKALAEAAPNRVDCYFDNVGGETSSIVLQHMNKYGRIAVCGAISGYLSKDMTEYPKEYLVEAVFFSVDPYLRLWACEIGQAMIGTQVGKIIASKSSKFPVGKYAVGESGWRTHTIWKDDIARTSWEVPHLLPFDANDAPISLGLGILGMPGNTAYFGFLEICQPQPGETVVITAAAGAVGSVVGQIAKIKGCTVIGITGSDEKAKWLKTLNFDHVINYKTDDLKTALTRAAPNGIDCYFDNVGGEMSSIIIQRMNMNGRIAICGAITAYNDQEDQPKATMVQLSMLSKRLRMRGFHVHEFLDRWDEGITQILKWIKEGKLKYKETVTQGFENLPNALIGMFQGENIGKAVVKV